MTIFSSSTRGLSHGSPPSGDPFRLFRLMAVAAGLSASVLHIAQPLLHTLSAEFDLSPLRASWLVTGAQFGYAAGLLLVVPLGDVVRRARLAIALMLLAAVLLVAVTVSSSGVALVAGSVAAAFAAVGAQVLVPMAAAMAPHGRSGQAVGTVMAGVVSGGMLGRAVTGTLADLFGWRSGYWVIAGLLVLVALVLRLRLPDDAEPATSAAEWSYAGLLRSLVAPLRELPALRRSTLVAALSMAAFTVHLVAITLQLSSPPFSWTPTAIGLFGLLALAGVALMPRTGRLADSGDPMRVVSGGLVLQLLAWLVMLAAGSTVLGLAVGVVGLIVGQQAVMAATQAVIYDLRPGARSRINSVYMTLCFLGGAAGSALAGVAWGIAGWTGACTAGITIIVAGLAVQAVVRHVLRRREGGAARLRPHA